jgi:hypothetical protein
VTESREVVIKFLMYLQMKFGPKELSLPFRVAVKKRTRVCRGTDMIR